jgi:hypothetical protein
MLDHRACVNAMAERMSDQLPPGQQLNVFEAAFNAVWRRAQLTLGEVTLTAIVNRVLYITSERYPVLADLRLSADGIDCAELNQRLARIARPPLAEGLHFVLVELLTVIGNLTAEILTPALHEALSTVTEADACLEPGVPMGRERNHDD